MCFGSESWLKGEKNFQPVGGPVGYQLIKPWGCRNVNVGTWFRWGGGVKTSALMFCWWTIGGVTGEAKHRQRVKVKRRRASHKCKEPNYKRELTLKGTGVRKRGARGVWQDSTKKRSNLAWGVDRRV